MYKIIYKNQNGQVLLFIIVVMTIALSIAIAVSTRTLASLSRVAKEDTSSKVLAAAETGVEKMLLNSDAELNNLINQGKQTINVDSTDENIKTKAEVTVEKYKANNGIYDLEFNLDTGYVKEIFLKTATATYKGTIQICWKNNNSAIYYIFYNDIGVVKKGILYDTSNTSLSNKISLTTTESTSTTALQNYRCVKTPVNNTINATGLRIRALYDNTTVHIKNSAQLPEQGYKITSVGLLETEGKVTTTKKITVYKSFTYAPAIFDDALYTENELND